MAAEKSSAMTKLDNITECCICLKTFTDPRMLPCIHTFCLQCLNDLADKSNKKAGDEIPCPVCRKEFIIPRDGVFGIQKNFFMAGMTEVRNALSQSDVKGLLCDICKVNNEGYAVKIAEATNRCLVCQENLCDSCCKMHKTFKVSKNHDVIKIGGDVGEDNLVKTSPTTNCDVHRGKVLDYYCAECKIVVCVSCFVESHKAHDCKDVNTVEEEFRKIINNRAHIISTLYEEILTQKNSCESRDTFLQKIAAREKEILQRSEELIKMIMEQAKTLFGSLDEIKNQHLKEIQVKEDEMDRRLLVLESLSRYCNELMLKGSASDVCRNKDELVRRTDELEEDHETYIMRPSASFDVTFQATDLDNIFKSSNGNMVGSVTENVGKLETFAVVFGRDDDSKIADEFLNTCKIKLRGQSEIASSFQNLSIKVNSIAAAAVCNNEVFMTGVGAQCGEIWRYSFDSGWKKCGSLLQGRQLHCAEFMDETLYICNGCTPADDIVLDSVEAYNVLTEKTTIVGQLKFDSQGSASVAYKGSIYVFGGSDKHGEGLDCVQVFNPVDNTCTLLSPSMPRPAELVRAVLWKTYAILLFNAEGLIFDFDKNTWQERHLFTPYTERFFCLHGMVCENERIFIIGGMFMETDAQGKKQSCYNDEVKYIRASNIVNNEATKWQTFGKLPKPMAVIAFAKLSIVT